MWLRKKKKGKWEGIKRKHRVGRAIEIVNDKNMRVK